MRYQDPLAGARTTLTLLDVKTRCAAMRTPERAHRKQKGKWETNGTNRVPGRRGSVDCRRCCKPSLIADAREDMHCLLPQDGV